MNLNALDLNLIRVFDALWRERSVTRAGLLIGLSQPAVSAALDRLRHALNDRLFVRRGNEMVPTPRAGELAPRARAALEEIGRMLTRAAGFDPAGLDRTFTLLGADFFSLRFMPRLASVLRAEAPLARLRLLDSARGDVARVLQDDAVDIALERPLPMPDWVSQAPLFLSPFRIVAARRHPAIRGLADGGRFPLEAFCTNDHVIRSIDGGMSGSVDETLARNGKSRRVTLALPTFHAVAQAVAEGHHIAAMPVQYVREIAGPMGLAEFLPPVDVPVPEIQLYWHARHDGDAAHQWMRRKVVEVIADLGYRDMGLAG